MDSIDSPAPDEIVAGPTVLATTTGGRGGTARRVVFLSAVLPRPLDGGNKVVLSGLVRYFAARHGAQNVHWVRVGPPPAEPQPEMVVHAVPGPRPVERVLGLVRHAVLGRRSLQEAVLWSAATRDRVRAVLAEIGPDLLVVDTIRMAQYVAGLDPAVPATLCYLDDLYSERYRAMIELRRSDPDVPLHPLASFAAVVPRRLRWLTDWAPSQRAILSFESRRTARSELHAARTFDRCLLVNKNEVARLRARLGGAGEPGGGPGPVPRVDAVRPLVPTADRHAVTRVFHGGADFLLVGVMSGPHNEIAVRWLLTEVVPRLRADMADVTIDLVGRDPSATLRALAEATPGVRLHGFVPDLLPLLARTCAVLNPPRYASGVKLKVLDALAAGVPVVSTTPGADGIVTGPDQGVLCADDAAGFARAMVELRDPAHNARVAEQARRHYAAWFSRDAVFRHYDEIMGIDRVPAPRTP